ncbi:MAG TPA: WYL domain-containing transcriptional regulator [Spirochaetia bacterium]|nr:WYL domain-containing transcriptional regulator [Spirochaetales bacterium]HRS64954.1 WYL domain-containing transcriptional regulator [Spirochaetia bacterium]
MDRAYNKAQRLLQIETLLACHPEGLSQAEIARKINVHRSTITRYIADLPPYIAIDRKGNLKLDMNASLINLQLTMHEAMAVHIAVRLLYACLDKNTRHASSAIRKLGIAMEKWMKPLSVHLIKTADELDNKSNDERFLKVFETLTEAWAKSLKIKIWYQDKTHELHERIIHPYFIEPYPLGQGIQLICYSEAHSALRVYKVERIRDAELLQEKYSIPESFDPFSLLKKSWNVWLSEKECETVRLRFDRTAAERVKETRWHVSQTIEDQADGSILFSCTVVEPLEMLPWIRSWGGSVEVLEPQWLRDRLCDDARILKTLYHA